MIDAGNFDLILLAGHRLGLPPLFYFKLADIKDDWAFVLKLHALFEGTIQRLLVEKAQQFELPEPLPSERDSCFTKINTAARLFLCDEQNESHVSARHYLLALNHLRNRITHDLRFLNLELPRYVASFSELDFQKAARSLAISFPELPHDDPQCPEPLRNLASLLLRTEPPRHRITTVRECLFNYVPEAAIWSGGGRVLTALSLCLHIQPVGDSLGTDPRMAATLQDLLHDPAVLEYKRKLSNDMGIDLT